MDAGRQAAFDRLAHLAAGTVDAPLTIVSLVGADKQYFVADYGLQSPFKESRQLPIDSSICRYTLEGESIISSNAPKDPLLRFHPSTGPWGIVALVVIPLINPDGHVLGTFCAIDSKEREWSEYEIDVMRELTLSVMTEINSREQLLKLKEEQRLREVFVAALTHDLRNPLHVSRVSAHALSNRFDGQQDVQAIFSMIDRSLAHADRMVQDLLDVSQLRSGGHLPIQTEACNPCEVAGEVVEELAAVHGARFELETVDVRITADPVGLRRIIENLAANAIKSGDAKAPVRISLVRNEDRVELKVENKGRPISEDEQRTIFEPFRRAEAAGGSARRGGGWGWLWSAASRAHTAATSRFAARRMAPASPWPCPSGPPRPEPRRVPGGVAFLARASRSPGRAPARHPGRSPVRREGEPRRRGVAIHHRLGALPKARSIASLIRQPEAKHARIRRVPRGVARRSR